jgi:hypothetical protein
VYFDSPPPPPPILPNDVLDEVGIEVEVEDTDFGSP